MNDRSDTSLPTPGPDSGSASGDAGENGQVRAVMHSLLGSIGDGVVDRSLIAVLQATQATFGYLPREALLVIAEELDVPPAKVYGVATFYNQFRFTPPGRHAIKVCMGTACAIKLGGVILEAWERRLGIAEGETTTDREYSLERVACVGCCSLAPVGLVGEQVHAHMTPTKVDGLLLQHRIAKEKAAAEATTRAPEPGSPEETP